MEWEYLRMLAPLAPLRASGGGSLGDLKGGLERLGRYFLALLGIRSPFRISPTAPRDRPLLRLPNVPPRRQAPVLLAGAPGRGPGLWPDGPRAGGPGDAHYHSNAGRCRRRHGDGERGAGSAAAYHCLLCHCCGSLPPTCCCWQWRVGGPAVSDRPLTGLLRAPSSDRALTASHVSLTQHCCRGSCTCGRAFCVRHFSTTSAAAAAQPQPAYADPDCVSTDLAARHQVGRRRALRRCRL